MNFMDAVFSPLNVAFYLLITIPFVFTMVAWWRSVSSDANKKNEIKTSILNRNRDNPTIQRLIISYGDSGTLLRRWPEGVHEQRLTLDWMPAFVTSIGVLGTFVGISIGLMQMNLVDLSTSGASKSLMESIAHLLDGMKTAFFTSVAGISAGLFLSLARHLKFVVDMRRQSQRLLADLDEKNVRLFDQSDVLASNGSQELVSAAQAMADSARSFNADAIAERMVSSLSPILNKISIELSTLSEIKKENGQEVLQNMMNDLRAQVIEPIQLRLESTASLVDQSTHSVVALTDTLSPLGRELDTTVNRLQTHQQEAIASIESVLKRFQEDVGEKLSEQLTNAGHILSETLDKLNNDLGAHLETLNALAAQMPSLDAELASSIENVLNQVVMSSRALLTQLQEGANQQTKQLKELHDEVADYHQASKGFLENYVNTVNEGSTRVLNDLLNVARVLATAREISAPNKHSVEAEREPA